MSKPKSAPIEMEYRPFTNTKKAPIAPVSRAEAIQILSEQLRTKADTMKPMDLVRLTMTIAKLEKWERVFQEKHADEFEAQIVAEERKRKASKTEAPITNEVQTEQEK